MYLYSFDILVDNNLPKGSEFYNPSNFLIHDIKVTDTNYRSHHIIQNGYMIYQVKDTTNYNIKKARVTIDIQFKEKNESGIIKQLRNITLTMLRDSKIQQILS